MRHIILHTAKAIARDKDRPGELVYTEAGRVLSVPSEGLDSDLAESWVKDGSAAPHRAAAK